MPENIFKLFLHVIDEQSSWSEEGDKAKDIMYVGEVQDGVPNGFGKLFHPEGDFYEGEFCDGVENGNGKYTFSDGTYYEGHFIDGEFSGDGVLVSTDGSNYKGEFENGEYHGFGIYTDSDGEIIEGDWIEGEFQTDETEDSSDEEKVTMIGTIEKFFFNNTEHGFMIASFLEEGTKKPITIKGYMIGIEVSQKLQINGYWDYHPDYDRQLKVSEAIPLVRMTREGIISFLSSGAYQGIGNKLAERIFDMFGDKTIEIIDEDPEQLLKVKGFGKKQLKAVQEDRDDQRGYREVMTFLGSLDLTPIFSRRIYAKYGLNCISMIKENPYGLTEINGIGYEMADKIATNFGFDQNSSKRAECSLVYMLEQEAQNGHTCFPKKDLLEKTFEEMTKSRNGPIKTEVLENSLKTLVEEKSIKSIHDDETSDDFSDLIAIPKFYYAEQRIVENLYRLIQGEPFTKFESSEEIVADVKKVIEIQLGSGQLDAMLKALQNKVLLINCGPGSDKTALLNSIIKMMRPSINSLAISAPTGRGVRRLIETTSLQVSTIHRLLEADRMGYGRNKDQPIEAELLIVDECQMLDTLLMDSLLEAIPSSTRVIMLGDSNQMSPSGPGMVFRDIIKSESVIVVDLGGEPKKSEESLIKSNAHHVRQGNLPELPKGGNSDKLNDFYFIRESDPKQIVDKVTMMVSRNIPERFGFDPFSDIQVLTPMDQGMTGTINLNRNLQNVLNETAEGFEYKEQWFKIGDKVVQQKNDYNKEVLNGDTGRIVACDPKLKEVHVEFKQGIVRYSGREMGQLALGYALTVRESQCSKYPAVIIPMTTHHYMTLRRDLLYSAINMGQHLVILIGMEKAIAMAVKNNEGHERFTGIKEHFREMKELMAL